MNVLLTRAKSAMIVFGNKSTLMSDQLWKQWIQSVPNISSTQFIQQCLNQQKQTNTVTTTQNGNPYRQNNRRRASRR